MNTNIEELHDLLCANDREHRDVKCDLCDKTNDIAVLEDVPINYVYGAECYNCGKNIGPLAKMTECSKDYDPNCCEQEPDIIYYSRFTNSETIVYLCQDCADAWEEWNCGEMEIDIKVTEGIGCYQKGFG